MTLSQVYSALSQLSTPLLIIFLAWREYRSGDTALNKKIKDDYKERNGQLEGQLSSKKLELEESAKQIVIFQTVIKEKDKQLERYEKIFANRNPDLTEVLEKISRFMSAIHNQNKHQTTILENRQKRDKMIDEASISHKGSPMMAPTDPSLKKT